MLADPDAVARYIGLPLGRPTREPDPAALTWKAFCASISPAVQGPWLDWNI
jgi:hypothetical protein